MCKEKGRREPNESEAPTQVHASERDRHTQQSEIIKREENGIQIKLIIFNAHTNAFDGADENTLAPVTSSLCVSFFFSQSLCYCCSALVLSLELQCVMRNAFNSKLFPSHLPARTPRSHPKRVSMKNSTRLFFSSVILFALCCTF